MKCRTWGLGCLIALSSPAWAEPTANDKVNAEALFSDGRRLMAAGNFREACPKFEASLKLDPAVGAMLNLADCYEKNQQTASAWAQFREASAAARAAGSKDREELARRRAAALEPKLSRLAIVVGAQSVQVSRDGSPIDPAAFGSAMPIDPGKHVVEATAAGKQKWSKTVDVGAGAARVSVEVPILADDTSFSRATRAESNASAPVIAPAPAASTTRSIDVSAAPSSSQRTIAIVVGGVGIVGVAAGSYFGWKASSAWSDAKAGCSRFPAGCTDASVDQGNDARSNGNLSTVAFAIGGAALAGAVVLWVTAPKRTNADPQLALVGSPGSVALAGAF
jgi:hypothetical protein